MFSKFSQAGEKCAPHAPPSLATTPSLRENIWFKVTRETPCPICGNTKKECSISDDGNCVACWHVSQGAFKEIGGCYFHKLTNPRPVCTQKRIPTKAAPAINFDTIINVAETRLFDSDAAAHAAALKVSPYALRSIRCGIYSSRASEGVLGFPMRDSSGKYIGVRLRSQDAVKWCIPGSKNGLFCADPAPFDSEYCFVVEGATNLAALLSVGLWGVGRPTNTAGHDMLVEYLRPITRKIVIIRDRDTKPAALQNTMRGAYSLAAALLILRKEVVKVITTPTKDVRDFMAAGNTATALIYGLVKNASPCTISQCQKELAQLAHVPAANTGKTVR